MEGFNYEENVRPVRARKKGRKMRGEREISRMGPQHTDSADLYDASARCVDCNLGLGLGDCNM